MCIHDVYEANKSYESIATIHTSTQADHNSQFYCIATMA